MQKIAILGPSEFYPFWNMVPRFPVERRLPQAGDVEQEKNLVHPKKSVLFLGFEVSAFRVHVQGVPTVSLARVDVGGQGAAAHFRFWGFRLQGFAFGVYNSGRLFVQHIMKTHPPPFGAQTSGPNLWTFGANPPFFPSCFHCFLFGPLRPKSVAATSPSERTESAGESAQSPPRARRARRAGAQRHKGPSSDGRHQG